MKQTPFFFEQQSRGARFMDFGGWQLPLQFQGILAEHKAVREKAGLFDISHMGQVWVSGLQSKRYLNELVTNDVGRLSPGQGLYTVMCRETGGIVDDLYVFCLGPERYLLIVNASRAETDLVWMREQNRQGVVIEEQPQAAGLALQGPLALFIMDEIFPEAVRLPRNAIAEFSSDGMAVVVARTGYTGEDGFELFSPAGHLLKLYPKLIQVGEKHGLQLCGLGARDTLRLEMGYRLYGQDMDEKSSPWTAGLGWTVKLEKPFFIGKEALVKEKEQGVSKKLIGFKLLEPGVARHGYPILWGGEEIGQVASGTFSPSLGVGIGMGAVIVSVLPELKLRKDGLKVRVHQRDIPATPADLPFYKKNDKK